MKPGVARVTARPATEGDLKDVVSLFREMLDAIPYYNVLAKEGERGKYTLRSLKAKLRGDEHSVLVVRDGSRLLGFAFSHFDDHLIWLDWFAVNPAFRRRGVGSAMLRKLVETAPARKAHKVWCDSRTTNGPAKATLRKNGFREIAELEDHWYGQDFILWERPA
ncbi:MAG: GNAT family N-acetyltransferase [Nitrososphaerales archaeon]